jgi:hypothetical protein
MAEASEFNTTASISPNRFIGDSSDGWSIGDDGTVYNGGTTGNETSWTNGDVMGWSYDSSNGSIKIYKNGTLNGSYTADVTKTFFPAATLFTASSYIDFNFGQRPFAYSAPSGFKALCTANLDDPLIEDGSTAMDVQLWSGQTSVSTDITGYNFAPDFVWIKNRNNTEFHIAFDTVRGAAQYIYPSLTNGENDGGSNTLTAFNSDGFTLYDPGGWAVNATGKTYVGWAWDAGSSTVSNTDGSISSSVRANPTAGFSIVTYTGTGVAATVGHGLNVQPYFIVAKNRNTANDWPVWHNSLSAVNNYLLLNGTAQQATSSQIYNGAPTSSIVNVGDGSIINGSGNSTVMYCFAPVAGYSAFGSYTGTQPFIYTGFRPRWIMVRRYDVASSQWVIFDSARSGYNGDNDTLCANQNNSENAFVGSNELDILSNGFKFTVTRAITNGSNNYIYAAFAEHPFRSSRAR